MYCCPFGLQLGRGTVFLFSEGFQFASLFSLSLELDDVLRLLRNQGTKLGGQQKESTKSCLKEKRSMSPRKKDEEQREAHSEEEYGSQSSTSCTFCESSQ